MQGKVYYVGDRPIPLLTWVNGFSQALTGHDVKIVPAGALRSLALVGDGLSWLGIKFPLHSSRLRSMTEDYPTPMEPTLAAFGEPPYSLEAGIKETALWLKTMRYLEKVYV